VVAALTVEKSTRLAGGNPNYEVCFKQVRYIMLVTGNSNPSPDSHSSQGLGFEHQIGRISEKILYLLTMP
jgi:hypothetical protein